MCLYPQAQRHITDLYEDLRDGHSLISLLEVLSGETLVSPLALKWNSFPWAKKKNQLNLKKKKKILHQICILKQNLVSGYLLLHLFLLTLATHPFNKPNSSLTHNSRMIVSQYLTYTYLTRVVQFP